ncbi:MAG: efflux RND transporter periplasmic adaptor subunit [Sedimenticola sp.]|nr:efflux RND transporter periplasmic adaptor subunit [Sedimenticola sp.]MCW8904534.1 efflux RND transporter periplasmic adaptor subunit [Sedimenticola sp.]
MKMLHIHGRTLALLAVLLPLIGLFIYVALSSGPLAPVPVTMVAVQNRIVSPALFGIGTVEARYSYKIGPTVAGRVKHLDVQVGDYVKAGQLLGEMEPVDLEARLLAQEAALKRAQAQLREAEERQVYASSQAIRYEKLLAAHTVSEELVATKQHELLLATAALSGASEELVRLTAEREALRAQRDNLHLVAPADGLVVLRSADPGTTVVAGQAVVELIDTQSLWVNVRFNQTHVYGLAAGLPAEIVLRSHAGQGYAGEVLRIEPLADEVTEETLAKVNFVQLPAVLPPLGELAEVTVTLPALPAAPVIPNAAIQRIEGRLGVWQVIDDDLHFTPVKLGAAGLDGQVQVREGLNAGDRVVVYSGRALSSKSRINPVERLPGIKS